jgi:hypothetical protein
LEENLIRAKCLHVVTHAGGVQHSSDNAWPFCFELKAMMEEEVHQTPSMPAEKDFGEDK